jgi:rhodanese-related sulfurtransferase
MKAVFWKRAILLAWATAVVVGAIASAAPAIQVDDPVFTTNVQSDSQVSHTFRLSNAGDEVLSIQSVHTSCGCTTAALTTSELGPGDSVDLEVLINTEGFSGTVTRTVWVKSNDPTTPELTLTLEMIVVASSVQAPPELTTSELFSSFYVLVDVRTPEEYAAGHLFGALSVPLAELRENPGTWTSRLPTEVPLVIYCQLGARSLQAARILLDAGFGNVFDLTGGLDEWERAYGKGFLFER